MKTNLLIIMVAAALVFGVCNVAQADTVVRTIQAENDDVEELLNSDAFRGADPFGGTFTQGTVYLDSSDLELGNDNSDGTVWQMLAFQFDQLGIPQGATINSATITLTADEDSYGAGNSNDFTILAEAADDASVISTENAQYHSVDFAVTDRTRTTASVSWAPPTLAEGATVDTPDIAALIQEVVDRSGWSANNRLTLMIFPDVYLALPDPATGGPTAVTSTVFEAGPQADGATLTVDFSFVPPPGPIVASSPFPVAGTTFTLTAPGETPWEWSKNGSPIIPAEIGQVLTFDSLVETTDDGTYSVTLQDGLGKAIVSRSYVMSVFPSSTSIPVAGLLGLGLLASACAMGGASVLRRKK